jgi:hypothetical protein
MFRTDKEFWLAVEKTCKNIEENLGARPLYYGVAMEFISVNQHML